MHTGEKGPFLGVRFSVLLSEKEEKSARQSGEAEPAVAAFAFDVSTSLFCFHSSLATLSPVFVPLSGVCPTHGRSCLRSLKSACVGT